MTALRSAARPAKDPHDDREDGPRRAGPVRAADAGCHDLPPSARLARLPARRARHRAHRGARVVPRQDVRRPLVLHPVGFDGGHAPHQRPDPRRRDHAALRRLRARRHRRLPDPGGWLPPSTEPARPPIVEGVDWLLSLVGLSAPDSDDHLVKRIIGLPGDHVVCCNALGQITVNDVPIDETAYVKLPDGRVRASRPTRSTSSFPTSSLWVLGDNRYRSKDSRYNTDQPGDGLRADRQRRRPRVRRSRGRSTGSACSTSTTTCSPASPTRSRRTPRRDRRRAAPDARATTPAGASDRDRVRRGRARRTGRPGRRRRGRDRRARAPASGSRRDSATRSSCPSRERAEVAARAASWVSASAVGWASSRRDRRDRHHAGARARHDPRARRSPRARRRARGRDRAPRRQLRLHHSRRRARAAGAAR